MSSAIPPEELPILEALVNIRNRLTALKKDSGEYIRPQDVMDIYKAVIKQVTRLNAVRDEHDPPESSTSATSAPPLPAGASEGSGSSTATSSTAHALDGAAAAGSSSAAGGGAQAVAASEHTKAASSQQESHAYADNLPKFNRVDTTLNDVFALLSLFFLTIGRSRETPAAFSQLACMKQFFDHLSESGTYTEADLEPFDKRLAELRAMIRKDAEQGKHPPALTKLMMRKLEGCEKVLASLQGTLKILSVELVPIHRRLIAVRRQIVAAAARPKIPRAEVKQLQEELRRIDSKRVDGKFLGPGGSSVPAGQAILVGILEECFEICHEINVRNDEVPMTLQPIYDRLSDIKAQLEHLVLTHRWTLRETDLWNYQVSLKEIDRMRVNGKFVDSEGKQPEGQPVLLYLLRRCYGLIYRLVASSEPISEELMPISNKLSTISKCLKEVSKYGGPYTMRDLYPYRLALHQIDAMRTSVKDKDGNDTGVKKWLGRDGSVPEGQAILRAQFEEVEQTIEEMLNQEEEDDDDEDESDAEWDAGSSASASGAVTDSSTSHADASEYGPSMSGMSLGGLGTGRSTPASPAPGFSPSGFGIIPGSASISAFASPMGIGGFSASGAASGVPQWGGFSPPGGGVGSAMMSLVGSASGKAGRESPATASADASVSGGGASPSMLATSPSPQVRCPLLDKQMPPLDLGQNSVSPSSSAVPASLPSSEAHAPAPSAAAAAPAAAPAPAPAPAAAAEEKSGPSVIGPDGSVLEKLPAEPPISLTSREQVSTAPKQPQPQQASQHAKGVSTGADIDKLTQSLQAAKVAENGHAEA